MSIRVGFLGTEFIARTHNWFLKHTAADHAIVAVHDVAVFCEKPLAFDVAAAQRMVDAVEAANVANQVGLILRFIPQFVHTRSLLADDRAGRLLAVSFRDDQFIPIQSHYGSTWRIDPDRCGRGTLLEHSIHDVDVLQWMCGPGRPAESAEHGDLLREPLLAPRRRADEPTALAVHR